MGGGGCIQTDLQRPRKREVDEPTERGVGGPPRYKYKKVQISANTSA